MLRDWRGGGRKRIDASAVLRVGQARWIGIWSGRVIYSWRVGKWGRDSREFRFGFLNRSALGSPAVKRKWQVVLETMTWRLLVADRTCLVLKRAESSKSIGRRKQKNDKIYSFFFLVCTGRDGLCCPERNIGKKLKCPDIAEACILKLDLIRNWLKAW